MRAYRLCLLPGDGIGPEVLAQAESLLHVLPLDLELVHGEIGYGAYQNYGTPLPPDTLEKVRGADATLFGAVTTPTDIPDYFSPILRLRQTFELYANVRPCRSINHPSSRAGIDLVIVRENTEDLYCGIERMEQDGTRAVSERIITRRASERIVRKAFEIARQRGGHKVTLVHKANVLRATCGLFLRVGLEVAADYPDISMEDMLVDRCAMELVRAPGQFDVIVTTNLFGDILSDEASMLVGGLGLACSGNIGEQAALFEPVHGSAPKLAGRNIANPMATLLSVAMMLDFLGEIQQAERLRHAVQTCIAHNETTEDLAGTLTTEQVTTRVIQRFQL